MKIIELNCSKTRKLLITVKLLLTKSYEEGINNRRFSIFNLSGGGKCRIKYMDFLLRSLNISGPGSLDFIENSFAEPVRIKSSLQG